MLLCRDLFAEMKKNIAIVMGGDSAEKVVSLKSADVVFNHLDFEKYNVFKILIEGMKWTCIHGQKQVPVDKSYFTIELDNKEISFDGVFIAIHGTPGEDGKLQAYFDLLRIPYNTCGQLAAALTFDKGVCNTLLRSYGVKSAQAIYIKKNTTWDEEEIINRLGLPLIVKPNQAGSSFGINKVKEKRELRAAIDEAFQHDQQVNIETFIVGTEVSCGVHNLNGTIEALPLTEIVSHGEFFDYTAKYEGGSEESTPARVPEEQAKAVQAIAVQVFESLNLKGVCRADFIIREGEPFLIEVNTVPGLSEASIIPQQVRETGWELNDFFNRWIEFTLS